MGVARIGAAEQEIALPSKVLLERAMRFRQDADF